MAASRQQHYPAPARISSHNKNLLANCWQGRFWNQREQHELSLYSHLYHFDSAVISLHKFHPPHTNKHQYITMLFSASSASKNPALLKATEDDHSEHSTVAKESAHKSLTSVPSAPLQKSVRFDFSQNVQVSCAAQEEELFACWYSAEDYRNFKVSAIRTCKGLARDQAVAPGSYYHTLIQVYDCCASQTNEVASCEDDDDYDSVLDFGLQMALKKALTEDLPRLGLERLSIKPVASEIADRRRVALYQLSQVQKDYVEDSIEERCEAIASTMAAISLPSRCFALERARALSDLCFC